MKRRLVAEWRLLARAPASRATVIVLLGLTAFGAFNGAQRLDEERDGIQAAVAADRESFAAKRAALVDLEAGRTEEGQFGSPRKAHQAILSVRRPLTPSPAELPVISAFSPRPTPSMLPVGILTRHTDQQPGLDDPTNRLDGSFDLIFVTTWLLPLFALVLGCDVLSGDRERGSATLLASQGTPLGAIVITRLVVRYVVVFVPTALIVAATVLIMEWGRTPVALPALFAWLLAFGLYLAFWFALAAGVNAIARSTAGAAVFLLSLWVAVAIVVPSLAGAIVSGIAPPPDRLQGILAFRDIEADLNRRRNEVTEAYYAASPENRPIVQGDEYEEYFVTELYPRQLAFDERFAPVADAMEDARVSQARLLRIAGFASPTLAFTLLSRDLAGEAPERRRAFYAAADEYQHRWRQHFDHKLASMRPLSVPDYDTKPEFSVSPEPALARWRRTVLPLLALGLSGAGAVSFGVRLARRATPFGGPLHAGG